MKSLLIIYILELKISKICLSNLLCNMLVKTFYFPIDVLSVLLQVKVTKLDNTCLVGLILSSIALFVKNVIDSVSVQPLILDAVCPTIRAT